MRIGVWSTLSYTLRGRLITQQGRSSEWLCSDGPQEANMSPLRGACVSAISKTYSRPLLTAGWARVVVGGLGVCLYLCVRVCFKSGRNRGFVWCQMFILVPNEMIHPVGLDSQNFGRN